jgi:hypothetical protein
MNKLLSDTWDNAVLNEIFNESLATARLDTYNAGAFSTKPEAIFLRDCGVFLYDNPKMNTFNNETLVVKASKNTNYIFISKQSLSEELNKNSPQSSAELYPVVTDFITKTANKILKNDTVKAMSADQFNTWLVSNDLSNVAKVLELDTPQKMKM